MKKFQIEIKEKVTFKHSLTVEAESEDSLNEALDFLESQGDYPDDIEHYLKEKGVKIVEFSKDSDGDGCEFECEDLEEINDSEV